MNQWLRTRMHKLDVLWLGCAVAAVALLLVAAQMPLWVMELRAPQYPQGLGLVAYGTRLEGDLAEINSLNHYIGVAAIEPDEILELKLFPYLIAALVGTVIVGGIFARHRLVRVGLGLAVWGFAAGFLVDLQWWLYRTGHELDTGAPMRALVTEGFTPRVLGETQVINFESDAMVAAGFWLIIGAAVLVSLVPVVARFVIASWRNTEEPGAVRAQPDTALNAAPKSV
jgi:copper chaperone NosL